MSDMQEVDHSAADTAMTSTTGSKSTSLAQDRATELSSDPSGTKDEQVPSQDYSPKSQSPVSTSMNHQFKSEGQVYSGLEKPESAPTGTTHSKSDTSGAAQASKTSQGSLLNCD